LTRRADGALRIVRSQVQVGEVSRVSFLSAREALEQADLAQVQAQTARYTDTAALFEALGGG
jgi:outer membrane protein TolC